MTLTIDEIVTEVQREANRKHNVDEAESWNWPRFPLSKVVPLCSEIERLRTQVSREKQILEVWDKLQAALDKGDMVQIKSYYISRYEVDIWHHTSAGGIPTTTDSYKSISLLDLLSAALSSR